MQPTGTGGNKASNMGMDLVPINRDLEGFHLNWSWWGAMVDLLASLGADVSRVAFTNDGKRVTKPMALQWAELLEAALATGNLRLRVEPPNGTLCVAMGGDGKELTESQQGYLGEFCLFLRTCKGFRQC